MATEKVDEVLPKPLSSAELIQLVRNRLIENDRLHAEYNRAQRSLTEKPILPNGFKKK